MQELFKPSYLKQLCEQYGIRPSKKYGQNYLISQKPILAMVEAGEVTSSDHVIEVGPGFGVLTLALADAGATITAYEIEKKLAPYWEEKKQIYPNLAIVWGNVLHTFDPPAAYKVIANLPYQITSAVIRMFLEQEHPPERMIIMVQKEVAERMCAKPGDMSLLSVSVQYYGTPRIVTKVPKGNFFPSPKVDSAVIAISDIQPQQNSEQFFSVVRAAFANKRKQAWNNIASGLGIEGERVKQAMHTVVGNEKARAQELSVTQWRQVVDALQ